jgi:heat shock protein HslJ
MECKPAQEKPSAAPDSTPPAQAVAQDTTAGLGGTSWRLVRFEGSDGRSLTPDDKAKYTIAFGTDGRMNARIDCNRGTSTWTSAAPTQLQLGSLAVTRAMCPPGSLYGRIVKDWASIRSYVMKGGHLFLSLMADGGIYEFEPARTEQSPAPAPLESTHWKLTELEGRPVLPTLRQPEQAEPHLILNPVGHHASGSGGCNRFSGTYQLKGDRLSLGSMNATLMACPEGMETEHAFLNGLGRVSRWMIAGQRLELLDAAGKVIARFEAFNT